MLGAQKFLLFRRTRVRRNDRNFCGNDADEEFLRRHLPDYHVFYNITQEPNVAVNNISGQ
jgi:hypothetical protein